MKRTGLLLVLALAMFTFTGCDKIFTLTIPIEFSSVVPFGVDRGSQNSISIELPPFNLADQEELKDYLDKIESIEVTDITLETEEFSDSSNKAAVLNGLLSYSQNNTSKPLELANIESFNLYNSFLNSQAETFNPKSDYKDFSSYLLDKGGVQLSFAGTINEAPATGKLNFVLKCKVKVKVL